MKKMKNNFQDLFKDITSISKDLRRAVRHMPKYYRYNEGDQIKRLLVEIKLPIKLAAKDVNYTFGYSDTIWKIELLIIILDDCIEDHALLIKGAFTIAEPRQKLDDLLESLKECIEQ